MPDSKRSAIIQRAREVESKDFQISKVGDSVFTNPRVKQRMKGLIGPVQIKRCIPPSIKKEVLVGFQEDIAEESSKISSLKVGSAKGSQEIIKDINTLGLLLHKVPECSQDEVQNIINETVHLYRLDNRDIPQNQFDANLERLLKDAGVVSRAEQLKKLSKGNKALDKRIKDREQTIRKTQNIAKPSDASLEQSKQINLEARQQEAKAEEEAKEKQRKERESKKKAKKWDDSSELISTIHEKTSRQLMNFVKDSKRGSVTDKNPEENIRASPCGLRINLGFSRDGLQLAQDKLSFFGSADDWEDYYVKGKKLSDINRGESITFMKVHPEDWATCVKDIYRGENALSYEDFKKKVDKPDIVIPEQSFAGGDTTLARKKIGSDSSGKGLYAIVGY